DMGASHPFYYAPAVSVSDPAQAQVTLAAADSTFDDGDMNQSGSPEPNLTVLVDVDGQPLDAAHLYTRPITSSCADGCHRGNCGGCPYFTASARPVGSPVLLTNLDSQATAQTQALFLIYQPAASSCSQGQTTLVVLDVVGSPSPVRQSEAKVVPAAGK